MKNERKRFEVFAIREYRQENLIKSAWIRIGVAFENSDGSFNLRLHALPLTDPKSGMANLHMRLPKPKEENSADNGRVVYGMETIEDDFSVPYEEEQL